MPAIVRCSSLDRREVLGVLRVQVQGRRRDIGLGSIAELTLAEAWDRARELRKVANTGRDPIAARDKAKVQVPMPSLF